MVQPARILWLVLIAAFLASSAVQAGAVTAMSLKMTLAGSGPMASHDCDGCGSEHAGGTACEMVCIASFAAILNSEKVAPGLVLPRFSPGTTHAFIDRTGPPEPYPPRSLILS
jgi:hypothetical protein